MIVKLVMQLNGRPAREIALKPHETVIGRQKGCAIRIASHEISRLHCCLRLQDNKVTIRDLGSANGTFVNGQQIKGEHLLKHGDQLQLGELTFRVQYEKGQELVAGLPVDSYEYVGELVQDVVVLDDPKALSRTKPAPKYVPPPPVKPPPRPAPPLPVEEEILDALPAAEVEESFFSPAGGSAALPVAEVEQSGTPIAPPPPAAPPPAVPPAPEDDDEEVPFAALEDVETDDQHPPLVPPDEKKS